MSTLEAAVAQLVSVLAETDDLLRIVDPLVEVLDHASLEHRSEPERSKALERLLCERVAPRLTVLWTEPFAQFRVPGLGICHGAALWHHLMVRYLLLERQGRCLVYAVDPLRGEADLFSVQLGLVDTETVAEA